MAFVVAEDRPFSEVLTADYMMVNPFSARSYGVTAEEGASPTGRTIETTTSNTSSRWRSLRCRPRAS